MTLLLAKLLKWMLYRKYSQRYAIVPEDILDLLIRQACRAPGLHLIVPRI